MFCHWLKMDEIVMMGKRVANEDSWMGIVWDGRNV